MAWTSLTTTTTRRGEGRRKRGGQPAPPSYVTVTAPTGNRAARVPSPTPSIPSARLPGSTRRTRGLVASAIEDRDYGEAQKLAQRYLGGTGALSSLERVISQAKRDDPAFRTLRSAYPALDGEQTKVLETVLAQGVKAGAPKKELLAAVETAIVESGIRNLDFGDADSEGWRQERTSLYGTGPKGPTNVRASAKRFFSEIATEANPAGTPGQMAQDAQGSAFPERYDQTAAQAKPLLQAYLKKVKAAKVLDKGIPGAKGTPATKPSGGTRVPDIVRIGRKIDNRFGLAPTEHSAFGGVAPGAHSPTGYHPKDQALDIPGPVSAPGKRNDLTELNRWLARKYGSELEEMFFDPGINIKDGQRTSAIGGHGGHVHVAEATGGGRASPVTGASGLQSVLAGTASGGGSADPLVAAIAGSASTRGQRAAASRSAGVRPINVPLAARARLPEGFPGAPQASEEMTPDQALDALNVRYRPRRRTSVR